MAGDLVDAVRASASRLGINPSDLLATISYETMGKMSPSIWGGAGGKHLGLIQFSPENQKRYGVRPDQTAPEQMVAVESYLRDRGVKPGHGLLDIYSAVNAGRPGLYNASDAANGGAPGSVADKVATMAGHRMRANAMLGVQADAAPAAVPVTAASAPGQSAPMSMAPSAASGPMSDDGQSAALAGLAAIPAALQAEDGMKPAQLPAIKYANAPGLARARALAQAMGNYRLG